jgi:hypothetical protein
MAKRERGRHDVGADHLQMVTEQPREAFRWWLVFLVTQATVFFVVLALDPAGLDQCEPGTPAGPRPLQASIAGAAVVGALVLAVWRLRRWHLVAALPAVALSGLAWMVLVGAEQSC